MNQKKAVPEAAGNFLKCTNQSYFKSQLDKYSIKSNVN